MTDAMLTQSKNQTKVLILGATGMLGHQVVRQFQSLNDPQIKLYALFRKDKSKILKKFLTKLFHNVEIIDQVDVLQFTNLSKKLDQIKPDYIINCVGLTLRKKDLSDIEKCYQSNAFLPQFLAKWCSINKAKLIHFSTDCVFDGKKKLPPQFKENAATSYVESDLPSAFDHYGVSKYLGEVTAPHLTLRLSIVGRELHSEQGGSDQKTEFLEWILSFQKMDPKTEVFGYTKALYSGVTTQMAAREAIRVIKKFPDLAGLYHVSSEPISKYEIIQKVCELFKFKIDLKKNESYESNKVLDCANYSKVTGFQRPSWDEMLQEIYLDQAFYNFETSEGLEKEKE